MNLLSVGNLDGDTVNITKMGFECRMVPKIVYP